MARKTGSRKGILAFVLLATAGASSRCADGSRGETGGTRDSASDRPAGGSETRRSPGAGHGEFTGSSEPDGGSASSTGSQGAVLDGDAGGYGGSPDSAEPDAAGSGLETDAGAKPDGEVLFHDARGGGDGSGGSKHAVLIWGYGEHKPTPKPTDRPMLLDMTMKARLEAKGLTVEMVEDATSTVAGVMGKELLVISSSINRDNLFDNMKPRFRDVPVPTIVMKDGTIEVMGLGSGSAGGFSTDVGQTQIAIVAPGDPLAAGLMGNVGVYTKGDRLIWASPGPDAKKIATIVGNPNEVAIFAYTAGALMVGGVVAPAKRMGFFIHRNTDYSPNGLKLFDAAVDYLLD